VFCAFARNGRTIKSKKRIRFIMNNLSRFKGKKIFLK
jgi:hypothetical protein